MKIFTANFFCAALLLCLNLRVAAQTKPIFPIGHPNAISINRNLPITAMPTNRDNRQSDQITGTPAPVIEWQKCLGSNYGDFISCIQLTADGGYIVAGYSVGADNGDVMGHHGNATVGDLWIVKLDKTGRIEWQKSLGGTDSEQGAFVVPTNDGGYIVGGGAASGGCDFVGSHGGFDYYVVKLSSKGDVVWQKLYGGTEEDIATSVALSADGGYFVAGHSMSNNGDVTSNHGAMDYWIIKIDATGKLIWQKSLGGSDFDVATSVQSTADGGCIATGSVWSNNGNITGYHGAGDFWVVKLDKTGTIQWQKTLGGSYTENAWCVQVTKDGGYILSGSTNSFDGDVTGNHTGYDCWIVKLDAAGNLVWQKCFGGTSNESANYIQLTPDGGYVLVGYSLSADGDFNCNAGLFDALIMKISSTGTLEWQKTLGGQGSDEAFCVQALADGSFIVAANTSSAEVAGYHVPTANAGDISDYWILKLSAPLATIPAPVVTIDPASARVCSGYAATIQATVLYGGISPVYQWKKNGVLVGTNSPLYTDTNFANNDQVSCTVTSGTVCENSFLQGTDGVSIKVIGNVIRPTITILADNTFICNCTTVKINATISNGGASPKYQWMINGMNTGYNSATLISNTLKNGDIVTCVYSDNASCVVNGSVTSNAISFSVADGSGPSVTIVTSADTICKGSLVNFTATTINAGSNPTYQWKINNENTGTNSKEFASSAIASGDVVTCTIKSDPVSSCVAAANANSNSIKMHTTDLLNPAVTISASSVSICKGSTVTFTAMPVNAGTNPSYQWKINGVNAGTNDKKFISASFANNDIISCIINTDPLYSCTLSSQAVSGNIVMSVTNGNLPSVTITAVNNNACANEAITFTAEAVDAGSSPTYQWVLNNSILPGNSLMYTSNKLVNGDHLFCKILPGTGACSSAPDSSNIIIAVIKDTLTVSIAPPDTTITPGNQLLLRPTTSNDIVSFTWTPMAKLINPLSLFTQTSILNESTSYSLEVVNAKGCKSIATSNIKIFTSLYMPAAFTPNCDGVNELYRIPPSTSLTLKEFTIYDRWGSLVFSTKDLGLGWNGTFKGKKQNAGSFIYYIKCLINNREVFMKGSFLLIR